MEEPEDLRVGGDLVRHWSIWGGDLRDMGLPELLAYGLEAYTNRVRDWLQQGSAGILAQA